MFLVRLHRMDLALLAGLVALLFGTVRARAQGDIPGMRAQMERAIADQQRALAEAWGKRIVDAAIAQYGPNHYQTGASYYNWANELQAVGRHQEAVDAFRRSIVNERSHDCLRVAGIARLDRF